MLKIDYNLGLFIGTGPFELRGVWRAAGFKYSLKSGWTTDRAEVAERILGAEWTQAALDHQGGVAGMARLSQAMSYAADTTFCPPIPEGNHPRTGKPFVPLGYQKAGVEFALSKGDCLIADAPGLGKTIQAILYSNCVPEARRILVICPASLKDNWKREWELWDTKGMSVGIAETSHKVRVADGNYKNGKTRWRTVILPEFWPNTEVVIVNPDILDRFTTEIKPDKWDLVVVDESHSLKNPESNRTTFILGGIRKVKYEGRRGKVSVKFKPINTTKFLFLTGTPMLNRPKELWPVIKRCDPEGLGVNYERYAYTYCAAWWNSMKGQYGSLDDSGASNEEELGQRLRGSFMIRRLKQEVMKDLPPKMRNVVLLNSPEIRSLVERENEIAEQLKMFENIVGVNQGDQIVKRAHEYGFDEPDLGPQHKKLKMEYAAAVSGLTVPEVEILFNEMAVIRHELGLAKTSAVLPWVRDFLEGGEKLILFAFHKEVIDILADELADFQPAVITGATPVKKRQPEVDRFQNDENCRIIILNILAGGVGFTLTRASDVAFAEGDWVPSNLTQAEDRAHRIGQEADCVMVFYLFADNSLDSKIAQSSHMKEEKISKILDT